MADLKKVRAAYVAGLQDVAADIGKLAGKVDRLGDLFNGAALTGTFDDAELLADVTSQHLTAAEIATFTANGATVRAAITTTIQRNMAKCVGKPAG